MHVYLLCNTESVLYSVLLFVPPQLCVVAYNRDSRCQEERACITITVLRNVNPPVFNPPHYYAKINECTQVGDPILTVTASDLDVKDNVSVQHLHIS